MRQELSRQKIIILQVFVSGRFDWEAGTMKVVCTNLVDNASGQKDHLLLVVAISSQ